MWKRDGGWKPEGQIKYPQLQAPGNRCTEGEEQMRRVPTVLCAATYVQFSKSGKNIPNDDDFGYHKDTDFLNLMLVGRKSSATDNMLLICGRHYVG